ncbi:isoquinoline 1-oxidoreductase [Hydrogenophaga crassostreae]|uniref:Isoquinoline 1-oxidoreductase n=1 Tax=Hydrogenophaga crassostreae TaxID=1763535 RepID=A0A167GXQ8_9BURK|nr:xanthine dehydrogenase family protein molybdopterin-binding subunit [Hydrogenophaga crassostreae]AOW12818.1 isoquinoline 1-oxidoreductase [Hydrogenophaga crassostreae]OAD40005.1 isoquinoline 1-oxidoreductase [Hydrogenophaga crassostreae]
MNTFDAPDIDKPAGLTRRGLLASAGAALVVGFTLPRSGRALAASDTPFAPNAWLRITPDNRITVICGSSEMGQGVLTAIPQLMAEELDADWSAVTVEQAPVSAAFNNPAFGMQATGGSTTIRGHWDVMRNAGATARAMLVAAAAEQWKVPVAECRTALGEVIHGSGKKLTYGALAEAASRQKPPEKVALKDPKDFKIIGQRKKRLDTVGKTDGSARYGIDVSLPGMLVAVMARAPLPGAKVVKVDDSLAKAVKGVKQVITLPSGVAVLASGYWAAKKGRDALKVDWDLGAGTGLSSAKVTAMLTEGASAPGAVAKKEGDEAAKAERLVEATYEAPYLAHACMEPMNCTAWVKPGSVEVWAGTQSQGPVQGILSQVAAVDAGSVKVNTMMLGGGFGRRFAPDFVIDATLLSKMSGSPVKLIYSREDDMAAGFYRPASVAKFTGGLDAAGKVTVLKVGVGTPSIMAASGFMKIPDNGVDSFAMEGIADHPYDVANQRIAFGRKEPGPNVWFWRSVGHSQNIFFMESFVDELAAAAGKDPFEFRRAMLDKQPRYKKVLEVAADKAGWGSPLPAGVFRGIAVAQSFGSYVAEVAEVSVNADGRPRVHRVVAAVDCGMTVNPTIIERQIEGAIVFGLSAALYGKITLKDGRVEQGNFHDYPVLRSNEMPGVEVHIVPSTEKPGGIGEPGTPPIAPAVANALFAATGKRLRSLPFDAEQLKKA